MKNLLKLPALLLAVMLLASCGGDSKKEDADGKKGDSGEAAMTSVKQGEAAMTSVKQDDAVMTSVQQDDAVMTSVQQAEADGKEIGGLMCEAQKLMASGDMEKLEELGVKGQKLENEMKEKWGPEGNASDEDRAAFEKAMEAAMKDCM